MCLSALLCGLLSTPSFADAPIQLKKDEPVLLEATELGYDRVNSLVVAIGNVEMAQGDYVVRADQISYNQNTAVVRAKGNVSILQPDGNVYFAEDVELKDDLKNGVVQNFRARLKDNSVFAAREAKRINQDVTELSKAVYSPCKLCKRDDGIGKPPLWQIKSEHVKVDEAKEKITYNNAFFEVYGVPVAYTPYFSHPTPDAQNQSGILTPEYSRATNLGYVVKAPVFLSFAPNVDATITPIYTSKEGEVLGLQWRHLLENGYYEFNGSGTYPQKRDDFGNEVAGKEEFRGHIEGGGRFALSDNITTGFNFKRTTDDTYLRRYKYGEEDLLTSRVFAERIKDRNYGVVQAVAFQGLRVSDDPKRSPKIIPAIDVSLQSDPSRMLYNSRFLLDANAMVLSREKGSETRRIATKVGWKLPIVTYSGIALDTIASVRADGIDIENNELPAGLGVRRSDGNQSRVIPEIETTVRYPLIKRYAGGESLTIEPIIQAAVSPSRDNTSKIPNEDSQVREFSDANLFSTNRFTGWDALETGPRLGYGLRSQLELDGTKRLQMLLGQTYQQNIENNFPLTGNGNKHVSDVVGRVGLTYDKLDVSYRFKLDPDESDISRNEVNAYLGWNPISLGVNYAYLNNDAFTENFEDISAFTTVNLSDNWLVSASGRRDLRDKGGMVDSMAALTYKNECITLTARAAKTFTRDRDVEPDTSVTLQVGLKNLE
jgi:LPS-assembly protein